MGKAAASTRIGRVINTPCKTHLKLQLLWTISTYSFYYAMDISYYQDLITYSYQELRTYSFYAAITSQRALPKQVNWINIDKSMGYAFTNTNEAQIRSHLAIDMQNSSGKIRKRDCKNKQEGGRKPQNEWTKTKGASIKVGADTRRMF